MHACCATEPFRGWQAQRRALRPLEAVADFLKMQSGGEPWRRTRSSPRDGLVQARLATCPRTRHPSRCPGSHGKRSASEGSKRWRPSPRRSESKRSMRKRASGWRCPGRCRKACWLSRARPRERIFWHGRYEHLETLRIESESGWGCLRKHQRVA